jgi:hypothetical protein
LGDEREGGGERDLRGGTVSDDDTMHVCAEVVEEEEHHITEGTVIWELSSQKMSVGFVTQNDGKSVRP